jgi:hypothetical protein
VNTESYSEFFQKGKNEMKPNSRNELFDIGQARIDYEKVISIYPKYQLAIDALKKLNAK